MAKADPRPSVQANGQDGTARDDGVRHVGGVASGRVAVQRPPAAAPAGPQPQATPQVQVQVPDRPRLASGVRPAGEMVESAFEDPPWLVEHEGAGYVQVTRLLYLIAESCDGKNTLEEIAKGVSDEYGKQVSADNVKTLVAGQLIPKGLVENGDGQVLAHAEAGA